MPRLMYMSLMRLPTEKAHGLQIVQNCEALADAGYTLELWVANRRNTPQMRTVRDVYAYYGVKPNFVIRHVPVIDLFPLCGGNLRLERIAFYVQILSYICAMWLMLLFHRADLWYSRDEYLLAALSLIKSKRKLAYEAHLFASNRLGAWLQRLVIRRVGSVIAITPRLGADLIAQRGAQSAQLLIAHDGIRAARFEAVPDQAQARHEIGWDQTAFIVGFVGRLHMIQMDKGVSTLIQALAQTQVRDVSLAIVGGPDDMAEALRQQWLGLGLASERFLYAGHIAPQDVPRYLSAFDLCAMPHPYTPQFAYYTSPLKLFEYMASRRAIIASDLPAWTDVVTHEVSAWLVPAGDVTALTQAIERLRHDAELRSQLANHAYERVMQHYTWSARAKAIQKHLER